MRPFTAVLDWLRSFLLRGRHEREMREEMAEHIERATDRLAARGLSPDEARRAALREFGNVGYLQEEARDAFGGRWVDSLVADARFGFRQFRRNPLATGTAVAILALGIGANTGVFTFLHSVLTLPPPGIPRDETLVRVRGLALGGSVDGVSLGTSNRPLSYPEVADLAAESRVFQDVAAWDRQRIWLERGGADAAPVGLSAHFVTANFFSTLGVVVSLGPGLPEARRLAPGDSYPVVVLGYATWMGLFGGDSGVVGQVVRVNATPATIVGVAPPRFRGPDALGDLWLPLTTRQAILGGGPGALTAYDSLFLSVVARIPPGITLEEASTTARMVAERAALASTPDDRGTISADVAPLLSGNSRPEWVRARVLETAVVGVFSMLVLAITCTHVAALLAAAGLSRRREIAIRIALGAGRRRVVRQLLTESVLRAVLGGGVAALVVWVLVRTLGARLPEIQLEAPWSAIAFTLFVATLAGVLVGIAPALHTSRLSTAEVLKDSAASITSRTRLSRGLLVTQIALTQPILTGVVALLLLVGGEWRGFGSPEINDRILQVNLSAVDGDATRTDEEVIRRVRDRLASTPGVVGVAPQTSSPDFGTTSTGRAAVHAEDAVAGSTPGGAFGVRLYEAPPGFFDLMGMRLVLGRGFLPEDGAGSSAAATVVSTETARRLWGDESPIGRRLSRIHMITGAALGDWVVVGVVDETHAALSYSGNGVPLYRPPRGVVGSRFLVRTEGPAEAFIPTVRAIALQEAPGHSLTETRTLSEISSGRREEVLQVGVGAGAGGVLALLLSAVGLYGVLAASVAQRMREVGIRAALGAGRGRISRLFLFQGLKLGLLGVVIGVPLGVPVTIALAAETGVPEPNLVVAATVTSLGVLLVISIASWLPARQAARLDPQAALRLE